MVFKGQEQEVVSRGSRQIFKNTVTYEQVLNRFSSSLIVKETGRQNPRQKNISLGGASANGATGSSSILLHRSKPPPSVKHCLAAIAA